ncbi:serine hydrolase [Actinomadura sp. DSM 109109]|nr:serine hydrolase [Actinomadura lepetitiana]
MNRSQRLLVALASATAVALPTGVLAADRTSGHSGTGAGTRAALRAVVEQGTPGVIAEVSRRDGTWTAAYGVADTRTGRRRTPPEHFRIASMTKPFTAATLLLLEADGLLSLEDSVERWLPGVVRGNGYDAEKISIRRLLNHTSGISNYNDDAGFRARYAGDAFEENRYTRVTPRELVDIALAHPPVFPPGQKGRWKYSDTNFVLAGMVIERVTGHRYERVVDERIIQPLDLDGTRAPGPSPKLPRPHAVHYSTLFEDVPDAKVRDVTELSPTVAFAAGEIVSTTRDVNRFMTSLMRGEFLRPRQRRAMLDTVPVGTADGHGGADDLYGLGIRKFRIAEGCWVWGHGGMIPGSASRTAVTGDGGHALTMNRNGDWGDQRLEDEVLRAEFCPR